MRESAAQERLKFTGATGLVVLAGHVWLAVNPGAGNLFVTFFVALIPAIIYAIGVGRPGPAIVYGRLLFGLTAAAWLVAFLASGGLAIVWTFLAFGVTLIISIVGTIHCLFLRD